MKHKWLYFGVLLSLLLLVLFSLGGGLWGATNTLNHWTGELFRGVCHQNPERSFIFKGTYMAVNTRCFGIFSGLFVGWMLIPVFAGKGKKIKNNWLLLLLLFAVILQIIDYSGNLFGIWENTNSSRFVLGSFLGITASLSISDQFVTNKEKGNTQ